MNIAICGNVGSGKDTLANILKEKLSDCFTIAFADKLKEQVAEIYNIAVKNLYEANFKESLIPNTTITYRQALCDHADYIKYINPKFYIDHVVKHWENTNYSNFIVTDVRFENELIALKEEGFIIIRINRESEYKNSNSTKNHSSETELKNKDPRYDFVINHPHRENNKESLEYLEVAAIDFIRYINNAGEYYIIDRFKTFISYIQNYNKINPETNESIVVFKDRPVSIDIELKSWTEMVYALYIEDYIMIKFNNLLDLTKYIHTVLFDNLDWNKAIKSDTLNNNYNDNNQKELEF